MEMMDMTGQVALVPGANGEIGHRVAVVLAGCGCDVALAYNSGDTKAKRALEHARRLERRARIDRLDATSQEACARWVDDVAKEYGRIDILASCVGLNLSEGFKLFTEQPPSVWKQFVDVQMMAYINLSHAAVRHMIGRKSGRIMTIGSDGGKVGQSGAAVASAAHGGMIAFSKALAREVGRFGITVNVVCPGPTEGAKLERLRSHGTTGSKIVEEMIRRVPMKRAGSADEIAATMAFLASKEGGYITGQAISVSGGLTMN
jgi:2-hydroxycyclohexanecarboxyl-CoA dehydrogenase